MLEPVSNASPSPDQDHGGEHYLALLARLHDVLKPRTYLEIGTRDGSSLACATCASIAIDPAFSLRPEFLGAKPVCALYAMASDSFFRDHDPRAILGGPIDLAFLDGMHLAEFLLRDFANVERHCRPNSILAVHDCFPLDLAMARRHEEAPPDQRSPGRAGWWTGDVWRAAAIIREARPALRMYYVDAPPTGLLLVTGLDPASTVLADRYVELAEAMHRLPGDAAGLHATRTRFTPLPTASLATAEEIARMFWLAP